MHINRTEAGYSLGGLEAVNLPPRQSQVLLCIANDMTAKEAAELLECSQGNIYQRQESLHWKLNTHRQGGLISAAFQSGVLRIMTLLLAGFISTGFTPELEANEINNHTDSDSQRVRFRNRPGRNNNRRNREWLWDDKNCEFFTNNNE